jgi:hypothetical protein
MNAFGLDADGFPLAAPDVYVYSYKMVGYFFLSIVNATLDGLNWIISPPILYWAVAILLLLVGVIYWRLKAAKQAYRPHEQKLFSYFKKIISMLHWKNNDLSKSVGIVFFTSYAFFLLTFGVMSVALLWWLCSLIAQSKGHEIASARIKTFLEKGCYVDEKSKWNSCFVVVDENGTVIHEGLLIAMSDKEIAFFKKDGCYVFSRQDNLLLRRKLHREIGDRPRLLPNP